MIVIIDNYDSFVHNLARYFREEGAETAVFRNDAISVRECLALKAQGVVISPGPKRPADAGISLALIGALSARTPFLGVCLGHQCLVEAFGGHTERALRPCHGEARPIRHMAAGLFEGTPTPTPAGRYHSLIAKIAPGAPLIETAWSEEGELMAVAHKTRPWFGVQFHPESLLTTHGRAMIRNFLKCCGA
jgi:anthranilate synthase component 2/para-aminobenzoate synthetase component 2